VVVLGARSGEAVAARTVTVGPPPAGKGGQGSLKQTPPPGWVGISGTVSDAGPAGFTVVEPGGARVRVTTSGRTFVVVPRASLSQLRGGVPTVAVGHVAGRRALAARGVVQEPPGSIQVHLHVGTRGCSQDSLASAITAALVSRG
jgi:hypothetical protein